MRKTIDIDGKTIDIDVPDDATDQEIDEIVNSEMSSSDNKPTTPAPQGALDRFMSPVAAPFKAAGETLLKDLPEQKDFLARTTKGFKGATELGAGAMALPFTAAMGAVNVVAPETSKKIAAGAATIAKDVTTPHKTGLNDRYGFNPYGGPGKSIGVQSGPDLPLSPYVEDRLKDVGMGALNLTGMGAGKAALDVGAKASGKAVQSAGSGIESFGKTAKYGELKIPQSIAKKSYGKDLMEKKKNIVNDIAEFGVTRGNNAEAAADAMFKAGERFNRADDLAKQIASDPMSPKANPVSAAMKDLDISRLADVDMEARAQGIIDQIVDGWELKGLNTEHALDKLIEAKQSLNRSGTLFNHAVGQSAEDNLRQAIKKKMYLNLVDAIGEISPDIKAMNTEAKRLLDVNSALTSAASRVANHDMVGLTDFVLGGASLANPGALAIAAPAFIVKKAIGNGRFGNVMINLGRGMQGKKPKDLPDMPELKRPDAPDFEAISEIPAFERKGLSPEVRTFKIPKGLEYKDVADNSKILTNEQRMLKRKEDEYLKRGFTETNAANMGPVEGISDAERNAMAFMGNKLPPKAPAEPQGRMILPVSSLEKKLSKPVAPAPKKSYNNKKGDSNGNNPKNRREPGDDGEELPPGPEGLSPLVPADGGGGKGPGGRGKPVIPPREPLPPEEDLFDSMIPPESAMRQSGKEGSDFFAEQAAIAEKERRALEARLLNESASESSAESILSRMTPGELGSLGLDEGSLADAVSEIIKNRTRKNMRGNRRNQ